MSKCKQCNADLRYDPAQHNLKCDYCDSVFEVDEFSAQDTVAAESTEDAMYEHQCPQCGASIYATNETAVTFCSYCGSSVVLDAHQVDGKWPESVIPFKITKKEANEAYLKHIKKAKFAPSYLKADDVVEKTRGIYMPFKCARFSAQGPVEVRSKRSYSSGNYTITEHRRDVCDLDAQVKITHDALGEFADVISEGVSPFELQESVPMNTAYMSGFYADMGDVSDATFQEQFQAEASSVVYKEAVKAASGSATIERVERMPVTNCEEVHDVLCPVWFISNKQPNGTVSYAAVNGQTGKVVAEIPISFKKLFMYAGIISLIVYAVLMLTTFAVNPHSLMSCMAALSLLACMLLGWQAEELYVHDKELSGEFIQSLPAPKKTVMFGWGIAGVFGAMLLAGLANNFLSGFWWFMVLAMFIFRKIGYGTKVYRSWFGIRKRVPTFATTKHVIKPVIAFIASVLVYIINPVSDGAQYISAAIVFALTVYAYLEIVRVHNSVSGRKLSQLNKRGGDLDA